MNEGRGRMGGGRDETTIALLSNDAYKQAVNPFSPSVARLCNESEARSGEAHQRSEQNFPHLFVLHLSDNLRQPRCLVIPFASVKSVMRRLAVGRYFCTQPPRLGVAALHGLRVLDLSRVLAGLLFGTCAALPISALGPWCTQILGDMGAEVIKVEPPLKGDDTRHWGPPYVKVRLKRTKEDCL